MKTAYRKKKEAQEQAVYNEYQKLSAKSGAMKTAVTEAVMKKFKIHSRSTVYEICQRVEKRLSAPVTA